MNQDLTTYTVDQLKVLAYDLLASRNLADMNLRAVETELGRRQTTEPKEEVTP